MLALATCHALLAAKQLKIKILKIICLYIFLEQILILSEIIKNICHAEMVRSAE